MTQTDLTTGTEDDLRYLVSSPAAPAPGDESRPVLVFLHGQGEATPMPLDRSAELHGPLAATSWPAARERFLIIEPQRSSLRDDWIAEMEAVEAIVRRASREHNGDSARTYLTGFSLGGNGVLDFAAAAGKRSDVWAAFWSVDPTRLPAPAPSRHHSSRPMWISAGPLTKRNASYRQLKAANIGGPFRVTDESDDHVEAAARAYGRAEVYEWLLTHRL